MLPHFPDAIITFAKPVCALTFAGICWLAESVTPNIPGIPEWVTSLGLPVAMLIAVIYALVSTNKALRDSEKGRREDFAAQNGKLEQLVQKGQESRERLIEATVEQTHAFNELAQQLKSRPCQKQ